MQNKDSPFPMVDAHGRLKCKELWGGIRSQDSEISAGNVIGHIYSEPCCEGGKGGDIYYFGVCKGGIITRLAIARPQVRKGQGNGLPLDIPLAIDWDTHYSQITIPMTLGDRVFAYTDGIIDAPNPIGERFGLTRLKDALDAYTEASLTELKSAVLETLHEFSEKEQTHDDLTMIAMEIC